MGPEFGEATPRLAAEEADQLFSRLSKRERQVLQWRVAGLTQKQIGQALFIVHSTVNKHFQKISEKTAALFGADSEEAVSKLSLLVVVLGVRRQWIDISGLPESPKEVLSPREQEVVGLLVQGLDPSGIAGELFITLSTAQKHLQNARDKLGCKNVFQLVAWATREMRVEDV